MQTQTVNPRIQQVIFGTTRNVINGFILERQSRGLSKRTVAYYIEKLGYFCKYLDDLHVVDIGEISPEIIRQYLIFLSNSHNAGGVHSIYRAIRALFNWWEFETGGDFKNPIKKVPAPRFNTDPLPGISIQDVMKMVDACSSDFAIRDKSIILTLADTGLRASEFISLDIQDIDLITGQISVKHGKGNKSRTVYAGRKCRQMIRKYLKTRNNLSLISPLWAISEGERISFSGLREIIRRRAKDAGLKEPGLHDFRRCFAITMLRNGCDLITLSRLMGHSNLEVLKRYLLISKSDLENTFRATSSIDHHN
jgi:site-specific recombinase XerD